MSKKGPKIETKKVEVVDFDEAVAEAAQEEKAPRKPRKAKVKAEGAGTARSRKWNYGITAEGVLAHTETPASGIKGEVLAAYELLAGGSMTVAAFKEAGGTRHALRVLLRRGFISNTVGDVVYPAAVEAGAAEPLEEAEAA